MNSKKNSCRGNYMRKYGISSIFITKFTQKCQYSTLMDQSVPVIIFTSDVYLENKGAIYQLSVWSNLCVAECHKKLSAYFLQVKKSKKYKS